MNDYTEECTPPIPIGRQKFAYQCENIVIQPLHGSVNVRAFIPKGGKEPYPNSEKDKVEYYELIIERFTGNSISVEFIKHFKDKSEEQYSTNMSFSSLVNLLFTGHPANVWTREAPVNHFPDEQVR